MANELSQLKPNAGARRPRMRVGRGEGSGKGTTAGRGTKGAKSRSGYKVRAYFEGGQMPLHRRLPKRGFHNPFSKSYAIINLEQLAELAAGTEVTADFLLENGLIRKIEANGVKLLGRGEISVALHVKLDKISGSARAKIEASGGTAEEIAAPADASNDS